MYILVITAPRALELIKDAVILIQIAQLPTQMIVDGDRLHRSILHVDVPDLQREVVTREDVPSIMAELDVGDG